MDISLLNTDTIGILERSNWYPERIYDINECIKILETEGYKPFQYALEILEELGGIKIREGSTCYFDALTASGEYDRLSDFETIAGEDLFPIGEYYQDYLYVGKSKKIYIGREEDLYYIDNGIEYSLNKLCTKSFVPEFLGTTTN